MIPEQVVGVRRRDQNCRSSEKVDREQQQVRRAPCLSSEGRPRRARGKRAADQGWRRTRDD